jgi:hypothetical protein
MVEDVERFQEKDGVAVLLFAWSFPCRRRGLVTKEALDSKAKTTIYGNGVDAFICKSKFI